MDWCMLRELPRGSDLVMRLVKFSWIYKIIVFHLKIKEYAETNIEKACLVRKMVNHNM